MPCSSGPDAFIRRIYEEEGGTHCSNQRPDRKLGSRIPNERTINFYAIDERRYQRTPAFERCSFGDRARGVSSIIVLNYEDLCHHRRAFARKGYLARKEWEAVALSNDRVLECGVRESDRSISLRHPFAILLK